MFFGLGYDAFDIFIQTKGFIGIAIRCQCIFLVKLLDDVCQYVNVVINIFGKKICNHLWCQNIYEVIRMFLAIGFYCFAVIIWVGEVFVEFIAEVVQFAPKGEKILFAEKMLVVTPVMNDYTK